MHESFYQNKLQLKINTTQNVDLSEMYIAISSSTISKFVCPSYIHGETVAHNVNKIIIIMFVQSGKLMGHPRDHQRCHGRRTAGSAVLPSTRRANLLEYRKL